MFQDQQLDPSSVLISAVRVSVAGWKSARLWGPPINNLVSLAFLSSAIRALGAWCLSRLGQFFNFVQVHPSVSILRACAFVCQCVQVCPSRSSRSSIKFISCLQITPILLKSSKFDPGKRIVQFLCLYHIWIVTILFGFSFFSFLYSLLSLAWEREVRRKCASNQCLVLYQVSQSQLRLVDRW